MSSHPAQDTRLLPGRPPGPREAGQRAGDDHLCRRRGSGVGRHSRNGRDQENGLRPSGSYPASRPAADRRRSRRRRGVARLGLGAPRRADMGRVGGVGAGRRVPRRVRRRLPPARMLSRHRRRRGRRRMENRGAGDSPASGAPRDGDSRHWMRNRPKHCHPRRFGQRSANVVPPSVGTDGVRLRPGLVAAIRVDSRQYLHGQAAAPCRLIRP